MSIPLEVSAHAVERYQQRIAPVSAAEARRALSSPILQQAADFGAPFVRLRTGQRIVIEAHRVITVLPADYHPAALNLRQPRN